MNGIKIVLLGILALLALLIVAISLRTSKPPFLPEDAVHLQPAFPSDCLKCHGPGMAAARSRKHPPANDCGRCHLRR